MKKILLFVLLMLGISTHAENYPYRADCLWLTVPDHADWLYKTCEKAKVDACDSFRQGEAEGRPRHD